jgi:uncharacterized membrane protein YfhO
MKFSSDNKLEGAIHKPTSDVYELMDEDEKNFIDDMVSMVNEYMSHDPKLAVEFIEKSMLDIDETIALWSRLDSTTRSTFKKVQRGMI